MRVVIDGPLTIATVRRWQEELVQTLGQTGTLRVELGGSGPWDAAGLQLLVATIGAGGRAGHEVKLEGVPVALRALAERSGSNLRFEP